MCHARRTKSSGAFGADLDQTFGLSGDQDDRSIVEHQPVAVTQHHRLCEIEQHLHAVLGRKHDPPPLPVVGIEHDAIGLTRAIPRSGVGNSGDRTHAAIR